jgi:uncharacterized cupredoxin-like copper-binding protein
MNTNSGSVRRRGALLACGLAAGLLVAGCGGGEETTPGGGAPPATTVETTPAETTPAEPSAGTAVTAEETEFSIKLSEQTFSPGTYTFTAHNAGTFPHDLTIAGPGVDQAKTEVLQPGASGEVTVELREGTYDVWCSVGNHRDQGMETTITVG